MRPIDENSWKCSGCDEPQHFKDICSICKIARPARPGNFANAAARPVEVLSHMFANKVAFSKGKNIRV